LPKVRHGRIVLPGVRKEAVHSALFQPGIKRHTISNKVLASKSVCVYYITRTMNRASIQNLRRWFLAAIQPLWPVAIGSLSLRKSPCIRENCQACASGKGHSSYALYGRQDGRRFSIYVPEELVPEVRAAIRNGRQLQELINEAGVRYVSELKKSSLPKLRR